MRLPYNFIAYRSDELSGRALVISMPKIFCCYRRDDSKHQAGRIYDHLVVHFGKGQLFKDVDSIPLGLDFRKVLTDKVGRCDVLLALISDGWLHAAEASGARRLDDPNDFVRIEIESALRRNIPVIPVLVGQAPVPQADELPEALRELAFRNGIAVRADPDFHTDVERLARGIIEVVNRKATGLTTVEPAPQASVQAAPATPAVPVASPEPAGQASPGRWNSWLIAAVGVACLGLIAAVAIPLLRGPRSGEDRSREGQKPKSNDEVRFPKGNPQTDVVEKPSASEPIDEDFRGRGLLLPDGWSDTASGRFSVAKDDTGRTCLRVQQRTGEQIVELPPMTLTNRFYVEAEFAIPQPPYSKKLAKSDGRSDGRALAIELSGKSGKKLRTTMDSLSLMVNVGDEEGVQAKKYKLNGANILRLVRENDTISVDVNKEQVCVFPYADLGEFDVVRIGFVGAEYGAADWARLYRLKVVPGGRVPEDDGPPAKGPPPKDSEKTTKGPPPKDSEK